MLKFLINLAVALIMLFQTTPQPDPPRHDKYRDDPKAYCMPRKSNNPSTHECHCKLMCATSHDGDQQDSYQVEDQTCEMWCTKSRCLCHDEEPCPDPNATPRNSRLKDLADPMTHWH